MTLHIGLETIAFRRYRENCANAAFEVDLVSIDPHFQLGRIATVALARRILRKVAQQPTVLAQSSTVGWRATCQGKDAACCGNDSIF
jgi:hypothetical protein